MLKRTLAFISAVILTMTALCSCGTKKTETTTEAPTADYAQQPGVYTPENTTVPVVESTTAENTTNIESSGRITVNSGYKEVAMTRDDVIKVYKNAMDNVKKRCPGFTKTETQTVDNVEAGDGALQLANRILNLISSELLQSTGNNNSLTVSYGDDISVRESFPLFGEDVGCDVTDTSIITSAVCYVSDKDYKVVITVADHLNPDPDTSEFSKIMTPIATNSIASGIEEYLVVLDMSSYKFDMNYTGNEIECRFEKDTGRMTYLSQKMVVNVDIDLNLDLILFKTKGISATGTVINKIEYNDFIWEQ
jgi:hypothetical protein